MPAFYRDAEKAEQEIVFLKTGAALPALRAGGEGELAILGPAGQFKHCGIGVDLLHAVPDEKDAAILGGLHRDDLPIFILDVVGGDLLAAGGKQQYAGKNNSEKSFHRFLLSPGGGP